MMKLSDFDFDLPRESIAQAAVEPRDQSRLLHVGQVLCDEKVCDLPKWLRRGDLLVFNNTRVIPAKLTGYRGQAKIEVNLHKVASAESDIWRAFAKPAKRLRVGEQFVVADGFVAEVLEKGEFGEVVLRFNLQKEAFYQALDAYGEIPLPPYIEREGGVTEEDNARYQTIYASEKGAVAAPTAGLHFTDALFATLDAQGIERAYVTLHVGAGTFLPVKVDNIHEHQMHSEMCYLTAETAAQINAVKQRGGRVIAVGTTSLRVLESATDAAGVVQPFERETDIFITPGYRFRCVDLLFTNFHLPKSTLFMLVCAFAGMERMKAAYRHAIETGYRFYSYGDAMLLERNH